jgi:hypothetical protein
MIPSHVSSMYAVVAPVPSSPYVLPGPNVMMPAHFS